MSMSTCKPSCPECKGTGFYTGLLKVEPCSLASFVYEVVSEAVALLEKICEAANIDLVEVGTKKEVGTTFFKGPPFGTITKWVQHPNGTNYNGTNYICRLIFEESEVILFELKEKND